MRMPFDQYHMRFFQLSREILHKALKKLRQNSLLVQYDILQLPILRLSHFLKLYQLRALKVRQSTIHGPIGIKLGGKSAPEIALSIVAQLVFETNKYKTI